MSPGRLPWTLLGRSVLRSFFLQASWNFERMQNLGALTALAPGLRRLYRGEELKEAFRRHLAYFNTHPIMAAPVLGTILRLEERRRRGEENYLDVEEFREMILAPYAAMGDALFWGGLRPLAAVVALFFAAKGLLLAAVVFLAVFNLPSLTVRVLGLPAGYLWGLKAVERVQRRRLPDLALRLKEGTLVLLGVLCAFLVFAGLEREALPAAWGLAVPPGILLLAWAARRGISSLLLMMTAALLLLVLGQLF